MGLDRAVLDAIDAHRSDWLTTVARGLMDAGQPALTYVLAFVAAVVFAVVFRAWLAVVAAILATVVATAAAEYGKELIGRPRPPADLALVPTAGFAMPSSIAALTGAAAVPLIVWGLLRADLVGRLVAIVLTTGTLLVGAAMVYLGAHWVTDVLAGWALGTAVAVAACYLLRGGVRAARQRVG
ncbi:MAG: Phosphoesterase PA-phosphatase [Blastococcus sp.]|jgi:membrane-associated phospholipid phosphatase|nr:Phosphoesterase PA-phosphatase [Blastococcus sp.]